MKWQKKHKLNFNWDTSIKSRNLSGSDQNLSIRFQSWLQAAKRKINWNAQVALEIFYVKEKNGAIWLAEGIVGQNSRKNSFTDMVTAREKN